MKLSRSWVQALVACAIVVAMATSLAAQTANQGYAKVVRIKGNARYTTGNNVWLPLKTGAKLKPGTVVQTAPGSYVDLVLGEGDFPAPSVTSTKAGSSGGGAGAGGGGDQYQPNAEQNVIRIQEDSALGIDKLTTTETGTDVVAETQLDLQRGKIFGNVKKMSAASKYEVKIPNGVAGIRGTIYTVSAAGVVQVLVGSVVLAYVGPDGQVHTQVVVGGQQFDPRTGLVTPIPNFDQQAMVKMAKDMKLGPNTPPTTFTIDHTIYYVSPTTGKNGAGGGGGGGGP
jgi:hypothetical protein